MNESQVQKSSGTILFTGGGTAGHVLPCIALIENFQELGWRTLFIGSKSGLEAKLLAQSDVEYIAISTGKLRRYFSWQNLADVFRLLGGIWQSFWILGRTQPDVIFSKGGFVSFPVVVSAWLRRIPIVAHESDTTPGLANRLVLPFIAVLCTTFDWSEAPITKARILRTGTPMRRSLLQGSAEAGRARCGATGSDRILLVVGGSLGAQAINQVLREALDTLCERYFVIHICGSGRLETQLENRANYRQYEFVSEGWGDLLAAADIIVSRAGANALYELLMLEKLNLLVPLSARASRGDQIENARMSEGSGYSVVIQEQDLSPLTLISGLERLEKNQDRIRSCISNFPKRDGSKIITDILCETAGR